MMTWLLVNFNQAEAGPLSLRNSQSQKFSLVLFSIQSFHKMNARRLFQELS